MNITHFEKQGLKPVLQLSNRTRSKIKLLRRNRRAHGNDIAKYLRFAHPAPRVWLPFRARHGVRLRRAVSCIVTDAAMQMLLGGIERGCKNFNRLKLSNYGVFTDCNTVMIVRYLNHPRTCFALTERLVTEFTRFDVPPQLTVAKRRA